MARLCQFKDDSLTGWNGFSEREVHCPSDMIDQIGGWSSGKIVEGYGDGHSLAFCEKRIKKIITN